MSETLASGQHQPDGRDSSPDALPGLRRILRAVLVVGLVGASIDLVLLGHYEETVQLTPLILLGLGFIVLVWQVIDRGRASVRTLQVVMILFVIAGVIGMVLHYRGSMEFQLEVNPELAGLELFVKVVRAKAPPALGPGAMINLGLLGLAYAYRYPMRQAQ